MNQNALVEQVLYNCDLSDARFAGYYSICGLALRLRDLYKWEQGLAPWEEHDASRVLKWIDQKEQLWERLQGKDFIPIDIDGQAFDPFDTDGINTCLASRGMFYAAGYAQSLKPSFLLGQVDTRAAHSGLTIVHVGREQARDLLTLPALSQGDTIVLRKAAARLFVWDQIFYITPSRRSYLTYALHHAGLDDADPARLRKQFHPLLESLYGLFVQHEIGERSDTVFDGDDWRAMVAAFPHTPVELLLRAVKDALADTGPHGPLRSLIADHKNVSLGFYMVFHEGLVRQLFPEIRAAFEQFEASGRWRDLETAVGFIHHKAGAHAARLRDLFEQGRARGDLEWAAERMRQEFLDPL
jgi:hypothetical protein